MSEEIKVSEDAKVAALLEIGNESLMCQRHAGYFVQNLLNQRDTKIAALEAEVKELKGRLYEARW